VLQCVAVCCSVLQCVAVCCGVSQCVAVCYSVLQCIAEFPLPLIRQDVLQFVAGCCSVLQCDEVYCSTDMVFVSSECILVLQSVAIRCSILQCVAEITWPLSNYMAVIIPLETCTATHCYGVTTISRLLKIIGLFCRILSLL